MMQHSLTCPCPPCRDRVMKAADRAQFGADPLVGALLLPAFIALDNQAKAINDLKGGTS